jgi:peroxiredoxin
VIPSERELAIGDPAPPFDLPGTDGRTRSLGSFEEPALLVLFTCNHCPVAVAYEDRLIALARDYAGRLGIAAINPNDASSHPDDSMDKMIERARAKGFPFPYLRDEAQTVARAYGARCTPDPFLFGPDRRLAYAGRIDDSWKDERAVTRRDLRAAIDAVLEGRAIGGEVRPATGCSIKWRP